MPELKLRRIFLAVYFVNTNPSEERVQVLVSEKEHSELTGNNRNILRNQILFTICKEQVQNSAIGLKTVVHTILIKQSPVNFHCLYTVNCVAPIKIFIGSMLIQRFTDSVRPNISQQSTQRTKVLTL